MRQWVGIAYVNLALDYTGHNNHIAQVTMFTHGQAYDM